MKHSVPLIKWIVTASVMSVLCSCSYYGEVSPASYHNTTRPLSLPPSVTMSSDNPEYPMPAPVASNAHASEVPPGLGE